MNEKFYTILTSVGKAKIANAAVMGKKLVLKIFAIGDGDGSYYNPIENQTSLKKEVWRGNVSSIVIDRDNANRILIETIIPANVGNFTLREGGIFDEDGDLIAVGKYPESYKPAIEDGGAKDISLSMILEVSNASSVSLKVDISSVLATKKDLDEFNKRIETTEHKVKDNDEKIISFESSLGQFIKLKNNITIDSRGWIQNLNTNLWEYKILDEDITASTMIDVNIQLPYLDKAEYLKAVTQSFNGYLLMYATIRPNENILIDMKFIRQVI